MGGWGRSTASSATATPAPSAASTAASAIDCHNTTLGERYPDCATRNAFGDRMVTDLLDLDVEGLRRWIAVLVGFVPGCGPQIVVTTLYLSGALPFSALIANAISTDGDALFPAIALAPRAAIAATLYSALPAVLIGYGWMLLLE